MIERERRRLARLFRLALAAASGPGAIAACNAACGTNKEASRNDLDADRVDEAGEGEAGPIEDAGVSDAPSVDAYGLTGCYQRTYEIDAGSDAPADAPDTCVFVYGCGLPVSLEAVGCSVFVRGLDGGLMQLGGNQVCSLVEGEGCTADAYAPSPDGSIAMACSPCPTGSGRRPVGLRPERAVEASSIVGAYLAAMSFEESAAVHAFARMAAELAALRAPRALVRAAQAAEVDERRHHFVTGALARARGGRPRRARVRPATVRRASAVARENAVEGCVRETYGALVLAWQASHARDPALRRSLRRLAHDEARHAALSWAVATWIEGRLDGAARRRVERARARALASLEADVREPHEPLARALGLPTAAQARALIAAIAPLARARRRPSRGAHRAFAVDEGVQSRRNVCPAPLGP